MLGDSDNGVFLGGKVITFFVPGIPKPGGSKVAGFNKTTGKGFVRPANKYTKGWMQTVAYFAHKEYDGEILTGPIRLILTFVMPRPKNHYGTGRNANVLKSTAPFWHTKTPDRTKLMRSTEDALKGIIWKDDSQVCTGGCDKMYGEKTGVLIYIESAIATAKPEGEKDEEKRH